MATEQDDNTRRQDAPATMDETLFGLILAFACALVALWIWLWFGVARAGGPWIALAGIFAATAWLAPYLLRPIHRLFSFLWRAISKFAVPAVSALVFYCALAPLAVVMRIAGRTALDAGIDAKAASYWRTTSDENTAATRMTGLS